MRKTLNVGVLGGGSFGTALGSVAARCGHNVKIYCNIERTVTEINTLRKNLYYFPENIILPPNLKASSNLDETLKNCDMILHAIPVQISYDFIKHNYSRIPKNIPYIMASKGVSVNQKKFFSQEWDELFPDKNVPYCILSGPSFAIEVMQEYPTIVSVGCKDIEIAKFVESNLSEDNFRCLATTDVIGVEVGGALKNSLAVAVGIMEGFGYKYNTLCAFVTMGINEMSIYSSYFGGKPETLNGPSGIGDIMLTCFSSNSRNKTCGIEIAQGKKIDEILNDTVTVEGVHSIIIFGEIIKKYKLNMPIFSTLHKIVTKEITIEDAKKLLSLKELLAYRV